MQTYMVFRASDPPGSWGMVAAKNAEEAVKYYIGLHSNSFEARNYFVFEMEDAEVVEVKPDFGYSMRVSDWEPGVDYRGS